MNGAPEGHEDAPDRGRYAENAGDIPMTGWKDVLVRVKRRFADDHLAITAAGVAVYALLLATFPGLLVLLGLYGLVFDPGELADQVNPATPARAGCNEHAWFLVRGVSESDRGHAGLGMAGGALVTLWSASLGVRALIATLNLAYNETEKRSFVHRHGVALLLTIGAIWVAFCIGVAIMSVPIVAHWSDPAPWLQRFVFYARWPIVAVMFWLSLLVFYRHGPSRAQPRWSWMSWGALLATASWLCGTGFLSWYVAGSSQYHQANGSVGIVVLVLAWFLLCAVSVLLGAEVNAELERQTREDTTVGSAKPAGTRGAAAADTLGDSVS